MTPEPSAQDRRLSSAGRGLIIAALIAMYTWFTRAPAVSPSASLLVAAGVQVVVIALRRFVPADRLPQAMHVFELIADGVTILFFALGVFGGIARTTAIP